MKQDENITNAVDWALSHDQSEGAIDILKALNEFARSPGVNIYDIWAQLDLAIAQIEDFTPERSNLQTINEFCKSFNNHC